MHGCAPAIQLRQRPTPLLLLRREHGQLTARDGVAHHVDGEVGEWPLPNMTEM